MIFETLESAKSNPLIARSKVVQEALAFAREITGEEPLGRIDLEGDDLFALIQQRSTSPRHERKDAETHREYVDLQYCFGGGEIIDYYVSDGLAPTIEYDEEGDYQLFERPETDYLPLRMIPGSFAIFFPNDAHVPAINDGKNEVCHMVVFKIRLSAFG